MNVFMFALNSCITNETNESNNIVESSDPLIVIRALKSPPID